MNHLKINTSNNDILKQIEISIRERKPFSFCRFGDGEFTFINGEKTSHILVKNFCKNWGFSWPSQAENAKKQFLSILIEALKNTNFLGILDPSSSVAKMQTIKAAGWTSSYERLRGLGVKDPSHYRIFDMLIVRSQALGNPKNFARILNGEPIKIISCRTQQLKANQIEKLLNVPVSYTHVNSDLHLTKTNRSWLLNKLEEIKEFVVLVALGPIGKDVPSRLEAMGKVAIDMGSTIDAWASIVTRGDFKTINRHCLVPQKKKK